MKFKLTSGTDPISKVNDGEAIEKLLKTMPFLKEEMEVTQYTISRNKEKDTVVINLSIGKNIGKLEFEINS